MLEHGLNFLLEHDRAHHYAAVLRNDHRPEVSKTSTDHIDEDLTILLYTQAENFGAS